MIIYIKRDKARRDAEQAEVRACSPYSPPLSRESLTRETEDATMTCSHCRLSVIFLNSRSMYLFLT